MTPAPAGGCVFHLIAHTHWDREWYLPRAALLPRLVAMLDDLTALLERDASYRSFLLDGQTVLLEDYVRVRPERAGRVAQLVKGGRLEVGPWYVLADELIPSGEALVRNLLLGAADAGRWGGRMNVLYSPDAFGHPAVLPTLAREFDLRYGTLWRGLGGEPGQETDRYRWRGPDGQELSLWHLPPAGYEFGADLARVSPDAEGPLRDVWMRIRDRLVARADGPHIPVFVGADHHAAFEHLPRLRDALAELEPGSVFRVSRLEEFFAAAEPAGPVLTGELRWSYGYTWTLQGVHSARAPLKRRNSVVELWLERFAEPLAALARTAGGRDRRPLLEAAWRELVASQFHDTIAGCSSDAVAASLEVRLGEVEDLAREVVRQSLDDLVHHDPDRARGPTDQSSLVLWNPAARARSGVTVADLTFFRHDVGVGPPSSAPRRAARVGAGFRPFALEGPGGAPIPVQVLDHGPATERLEGRHRYPDQDDVDRVRVAFQAPVVPGLGTALCSLGEPQELAVPHGARVRGRAIANAWIEARIEGTGAVSLWDRRSGERYPALWRLESEQDAGDTYTFCPVARDERIEARGPVEVRRVAGGPLVAALEARFALGAGTSPRGAGRGRVAARLTLMLYADSPMVRGILELDNQATNHRLRARLGTGVAHGATWAGAQFGALERVAPPMRPYSLETPVRTAPAHRFAALAARRRGLAVLAPGFFEYETTDQGDLVVTLVRAVGELSRPDLPTRPGHAGWPTPTPLAQCLGSSRIEFGLVPVTLDDLERGDALPALWEECFLPLRGFWLRDAGTLAPTPVDISLEGPGLVFSAAKPAEAGAPLALRCYNATGRRVSGAWRFGHPIGAAHRVRADERASAPLVLEGRGQTVRFVAGPHELVTILIT